LLAGLAIGFCWSPLFPWPLLTLRFAPSIGRERFPNVIELAESLA
jgi:hypothetical protein